MISKVKAWLVPSLIVSLVVRQLVVGGNIAESVAIGFLCGLYGVELWFYLNRQHRIAKRELISIKKELHEIKAHVSTIKLEKLKNAPQMPMGNISWGSK